VRLSILDCGAVADGVTKSTDAINEAITRVNEAGGGYVIIPPGKYVSGTIVLKSNVYLWLEPGSIIYGSMDNEELKVPCKSGRICNTQIYGEELYNSGILGHGIFDLRRQNYHTQPKRNGTPYMLVIKSSTNITLRDVELHNPGWFTISCENNTNVTFDGIVINSRDCMNGDGIDFGGSKNVTISNCKINAGDDAIGLKTGPVPCENFTITNCVISSNWAGIRIGPESSKDMLNITVSNCVFNDCSDGIKIQNFGGSHFEDFTFSNLNMVNVLRPFYFTYNPSHWWRGKTGTFKRVLISNVIARMDDVGKRPKWFENKVIIHGLPDYLIEDVTISNMHVLAPGGGKADDGSSAENEELLNFARFPDLMFQWEPYPCSCMYIRNAARVRMNNCVFEAAQPDERPAIVAQAVNGIRITGAELNGTDGLIRHCKVNDLKVIDSEGTVTEESPEYQKRWEAFRELSRKTEREFIENDAIITKLSQMKPLGTLTVPDGTGNEVELTFEHPGKEGYIKMERIAASPRVLVNGKEVFCWDRGEYYGHRIPIAVDISEGLVEGENTIKIILSGKDNDFEKKSIALYGGPIQNVQ